MKKKQVYLLLISLVALPFLFPNAILAIDTTVLNSEFINANDNTYDPLEAINAELEEQGHEPVRPINEIIKDERQSGSRIWYTGGGFLAVGALAYFIIKKQNNNG